MLLVEHHDWGPSLERAANERISGNTLPYENTEDRQQWTVQKFPKGELAGDQYRVRVWGITTNRLKASCTCKASQNGLPCKHIAFVLSQVDPDQFPLPFAEDSPQYTEAVKQFEKLLERWA